jgi:hypothetical protein
VGNAPHADWCGAQVHLLLLPQGAGVSEVTEGTHTSVTAADIDRPLGPTENIYFLLDKLYRLNFVVFAEIDGAFDAARLGDALRLVQSQHPLLRARVTLASGRNWFKPIEADAHPIPVERGSLRNWRGQLSAQLDEPFETGGPLARFVWFGGRGRKSVAAMVFHHVIGDGRSGADVFIEVLRRAALEKLPLCYRPARASAQDLDLIKEQGPIGASIKTIAYWLNQGRSALKFAQQLPGFHSDTQEQRSIAVIPFALSKAVTAALREASRAHGGTVQGALGAAQLLAINSEFPTAQARHLALTSLADLRGVLRGGLTSQDLGLYIATVCTVHAVAAEPDFWALVADVTHQLRSVLGSGDANLVHSIYREGIVYPPNAVGARMVQSLVAMAPPSSMLTNVGSYDAVTLANGAKLRSLEFLVSPPAQHPICVTAATFDGAMRFNLLFDECKVDHAQALRIAEAMVTAIEAAAAV